MALLRAAATVGGFTMLSRVLGFVRDMLIAWALGAGFVSDAFFVATRLPNLFRSLFAEGAFNAAFVPVFAGHIAAEGHAAAKAHAEAALSLLLTALLVVTLLAEIFMPWLIPLIAAGFVADPDQLAFVTHLTRITFPYLLFISLVSLQGGVLTSLSRFAAVAATPMLLNIFQIGAVLWGVRESDAVEALCWGVTAAGVAQFLWLAGSCAAAGMALRLPWPRLTVEMRRLGGLMLPGVLGAGVTQINLLVSTNVASLLPAGSISYLQYADRLNQLPLAVVGTAVGTAILPLLSRQIRSGDEAGAAETQNRGLELSLFLTVPAAVALWTIAQPILSVLFERGRFDAQATAATAAALAVYAAGLPAFVLVKVLAPAFYARQDTATPVRIAILSMAVNLVLTIALAGPLKHVGNATATTVAGWVNAVALVWLLRRAGHFSFDARLRSRAPRIVAASLGMAVVLVGLQRALAPTLAAPSLGVKAAALAALIGGGLAAYGVLVLLFGAGEWAVVKRLVRRGAR
ncbi:MAG TPA: murein biosynthesis integral membrane protein MurJ [Stellaceae bacterium]|nr:murein biosynthesis integral membrane protein MurJ [Stellaceae bacterium]